MAASNDVHIKPEKPSIIDTVEPSTSLNGDEINSAPATKRRIRYAEDHEETGEPSIQNFTLPLRRRGSTYSVHSLSSVRSDQRNVDPAIVLPVQYRTLSYEITNIKAIENANDAREKTAVGKIQSKLCTRTQVFMFGQISEASSGT